MTDFLIIGGGIAGVSAAARLSEHGSVTLLEAEDALAYHASGRSAALFEENYGRPAVIALNRASRSYHEAAGVLSPRGLMLIGSDDSADAYDADLAAMSLQEIDLDDARARFPILSPRMTRVAVDDDCSDLDTDRLIQHFARHLRGNGGEIVTKARVSAISRNGTGWIVTTETGDRFEARSIVNAAGAWADRIAALADVAPLGITPLRRSMARIPAPNGHDVSGWPMVFGAGETWYCKPDAGALIVSPAEEDPSEPHDAWADDMVLAEGLARFEADTTAEVTRLLTSWAGLRSFSPDRLLVLGPDPDLPSFIWCAGQGGFGFQTAPAASRLLADVVTGTPPELDAETVRSLTVERLR